MKELLNKNHFLYLSFRYFIGIGCILLSILIISLVTPILLIDQGNLFFITGITAIAFLLVAYWMYKLLLPMGIHFEFLPFKKISIKKLLITLVGMYLLVISISLILHFFNIPINQFDSFKDFFKDNIVSFFIATVLIAPIYEEIFFRSFLVPLFIIDMNNKIQIYLSMTLSSMLFAVLHLTDSSTFIIIPVFLLGFYFSYITLKYKNLTYAVCLHTANNFLSFLIFNLDLDKGNFLFLIRFF